VVGAISAGRAAGGDLDNACARAGLDKIKESAVTAWRARLTVRSPGRTVADQGRSQPWQIGGGGAINSRQRRVGFGPRRC